MNAKPQPTGLKTMYEDGTIIVCVRARPFNAREQRLCSESCMRFEDDKVVHIFEREPLTKRGCDKVAPGDDTLEQRDAHTFSFDHAYPPETGQRRLFDDIGRPLLDASFQGFNTCVFAYGQTGSGKSYCMLGPEGGRRLKEAPGLIPRVCKHLFREIDERKYANAVLLQRARESARGELSKEGKGNDTKVRGSSAMPSKLDFTVYVSFVEIYHEKVSCLLSAEQGSGCLKVRQHPSLGVYVEGLTEVPVSHADQVLELMRIGNDRRHTVSTSMNDASSRSHAIFTIQLIQQKKGFTKDGLTKPTELRARINMVDLAGSERAKSTCAEGEALKEGAKINKSLTTLGLVISALADICKTGKQRHVPYRDSTLTFLLSESLGGNSKTFMLSTVSPAVVNYEESLSTLRYTDRAKSIVTRAFINETASDRRIRELENEVALLREKIRSLQEKEQLREANLTNVLPPEEVKHSSFPWAPAIVGSKSDAVVGVSTPTPLADPTPSCGCSFPDSGFLLSYDISGEGSDPAQAVRNESNKLQSELHQEHTFSVALAPSNENNTPRSCMHWSLVPQDIGTLQSELRRAGEVINQLTTMGMKHEQASTFLEIYKTQSTVRINRDDPYLLNLDGVGGWVVTHLIAGTIFVGDFTDNDRGRGIEGGVCGSHRDSDPADESIILDEEEEEDLSISLGDSSTNTDREHRSSSRLQQQYITLAAKDYRGTSGEVPCIGAPHCILSARPGGCFALYPCAPHETYLNGTLVGASSLHGADLDKEVLLQSGDIISLSFAGPQIKFVDRLVSPLTARCRHPFFPTGVAPPPRNLVSQPTSATQEGSARGAPDMGLTGLNADGFSAMPRERHSDSSGDSFLIQPRSSFSSSLSSARHAYVPQDASMEKRPAERGGPTSVEAAKVRNAMESPLPFSSTRSSPTTAPEGATTPRGGRRLPVEDAGRKPPAIPPLQLEGLLRLQQKPAVFLTQVEAASRGGEGRIQAASQTTPKKVCFSDRATLAQRHDSATPVVAQGTVVGTSAAYSGSAFSAISTGAVQKGTVLNPAPVSVPVAKQGLRSSTFKCDSTRFIGRHNFVFLGPTRCGKTALRDNLRRPDCWYSFLLKSNPKVLQTWGIDRSFLTIEGAEDLKLIFTELSGMACFSLLQDQLPTGRVTYILCFSLSTEKPGLQLFRQTLEIILCQSNYRDMSVVLVATHLDQCQLSERELYCLLEDMEWQVQNFFQLLQPVAELRPTVSARFAVDNVHRKVYSSGFTKLQTFPQLLLWLSDHALHRCRNDANFSNGLIPLRCEHLASMVASVRTSCNKWFLSLGDFKSRAKVVDSRYTLQQDLHIHTQLLGHWGVLQHSFRSALMRNYVIIDVEWYVRLLTCVACCGPHSDEHPDEMMLCSQDIMKLFDDAGVLPFSPREVLAEDNYGLLSKGILTTKVLAALTERVRSEKGSQCPTLAEVVDLLQSCDYIIRGSALRFSSFMSKDWKGKLSLSNSEKAAQKDSGETKESMHEDFTMVGDMTVDAPSPPVESFVLFPRNFWHPVPAAIVMYLPKLLTGPFYRFTFNITPLHFFPKLLCRLSGGAGCAMYLGVVQRWLVEADGLYFPLSVFAHNVDQHNVGEYYCKEVGQRQKTSTFPSSLPATQAIIPGSLQLWREAAWVIGPSGNRVFIRMVHHSLFIFFNNADHGLNYDSAAALFFDMLLEQVRELVEESPGARCQEGLLCSRDYPTSAAQSFTDAAKEHVGSCAASAATPCILDEEELSCYYHIVDENINSFYKIRELEQSGLKTARLRRVKHFHSNSLPYIRHAEEGPVLNKEIQDVIPFLRSFDREINLQCIMTSIECEIGPPSKLQNKQRLNRMLDQLNQSWVRGGSKIVNLSEEKVINRNNSIGQIMDFVVDTLSQW